MIVFNLLVLIAISSLLWQILCSRDAFLGELARSLASPRHSFSLFSSTSIYRKGNPGKGRHTRFQPWWYGKGRHVCMLFNSRGNFKETSIQQTYEQASDYGVEKASTRAAAMLTLPEALMSRHINFNGLCEPWQNDNYCTYNIHN